MSSSIPADSRWHFHTATTGRQGPIAFADLQALARAGSLAPGDLVWTAGMSEWTKAAEVEGLHKPPNPLPAGPAGAPATAAAPAMARPGDSFDYSPFGNREAAVNRPPTNASGNYIVDHWRGNLSLGQSFWVNGVLVSLGYRILVVAVGSAVEDWSVAGILILLLLVLSVPVSVWMLVGIWRSSDAHESRGGKNVWAVLAKIMVALGWIGLALNFFLFLGALGGARY